MTPTERQDLRRLALDGMSDMLTNYRKMLIDPYNLDEDTDDVKVGRSNVDGLRSKLAEEKKEKTKKEEAIALFNKKVSKGIRALENLGIINQNPEKIAKFFYENRAFLHKDKTGEYFGEPEDLNQDTLKRFLKFFHFKGMEIDEGMRHFLSFFDLPGEAQKVDRI